MDDVAEQNSRLKEALRRLQAVHQAEKKAAEAYQEKSQQELAACRQELVICRERLTDAEQRTDEMTIQLEINTEEMKDLAQVSVSGGG